MMRKPPEGIRLPQGVQLPAPRVTVRPTPRAQVPQLADNPTETAGHLKMAQHLHAILPGACPRVVMRAQKSRPAMHGLPRIPAVKATYEPAHPWAMWWHVPNEGKRTVQGGAKLVAMGLRSGVPDFALLFRLEAKVWVPAQGKGEGRGSFLPVVFSQAAFIEAKREFGGTLTDEQKRFRADCEAVGAWWAECRTVEELDAILRGWLEPFGLAPKRVPMMIRGKGLVR